MVSCVATATPYQETHTNVRQASGVGFSLWKVLKCNNNNDNTK